MHNTTVFNSQLVQDVSDIQVEPYNIFHSANLQKNKILNYEEISMNKAQNENLTVQNWLGC